ncbi:hypothetical protein HPB50_023054 [Hyalomma asiaticum]|uniref:Uncharacterized protein n=1 Tax=Hyalomma asiaticum TaxID=266040 RepID=A0ACB7TPG5_HYAAI|nr:hypothetical protein HPB50_023054 [Hyalomma asiaticum]
MHRAPQCPFIPRASGLTCDDPRCSRQKRRRLGEIIRSRLKSVRRVFSPPARVIATGGELRLRSPPPRQRAVRILLRMDRKDRENGAAASGERNSRSPVIGAPAQGASPLNASIVRLFRSLREDRLGCS